MRKNFRIILAALALVGAAAACQKNGNPVRPGRTVTIRVEAPSGLTKISLEQDATDPDGGVSIRWQENDHILVGGNDFTIVNSSISQDGHYAEFTGTEPTSATFDVVYEGQAGIADFTEQTQASDGDYAHLRYGAKLTGVNSYEGLSFSEAYATAHGGGFEQSSVIRLRAQLPADVASAVRAVIFKASEPIFGGESAIKVNFSTPGDAGDDGIITVYANVPAGSWDVAAGTDILFQFQVGEAANEIYTAHKLSNAGAIAGGQVTAFKISRPNIKDYANTSSTDIGTAANPYLIGDKHQLDYLHTAISGSSPVNIKFVDDIDATGIGTWTSLNGNYGGNPVVNLDGNHKTLSYLPSPIFYVMNASSAKDLTIDHSSLSGGGRTGALTSFVQGVGTVIENVDVSNCTISGNAQTAGLVGRINNGTNGQIAATITDCDVTSTNITGGGTYIGGVIGSAEAIAIVTNCSYSGGTVSGNNQYVGGIVGGTTNYASVFTGCRVEDATITSSYNKDVRIGGFSGLVNTLVQVKGCSVGTPSRKVRVYNSVAPATGNVLNFGGFTGINYGLITQDESGNRNTAYVDVVVTNSNNEDMHIGGFVGYNTGTIEYSDSDVSFSSSTTSQVSLTAGYMIGGFVGYHYREVDAADARQGKIAHCTAAGSVSGNQYIGGFAGYMLKKEGLEGVTATLEDCSSSVNVTGAGHYGGGLVGFLSDGEISDCAASGNVDLSSKNRAGGLVGQAVQGVITHSHASGTVTADSYSGGLVGAVQHDPGYSVSISRCYFSGNITLTGNQLGGILATHLGSTDQTAAGSLTVENCYVSGDVISAGQRVGGIMANHFGGTTSLRNCYVSGAVKGSFAVGGIVGWVERDGLEVYSCMPFVKEVTATVTDSNEHYSSGLVIGYAHKGNKPNVVVNMCYRPDGISFTPQPAYAGTNVIENHSFIATAAVIPQRHSLQYGYYHHGRRTNSKTCSALVQREDIGGAWSAEIWDFNSDYPTLK